MAVGEGTRIWAFAHLLEGCTIGRDCNICDHTFIEAGVVLGDRVTVKSGVYLWEGVTCEDDVFIGPSVVFTNDLRPRSRRPPEQWAKTQISAGASIGANATILAQTVIGRHAMVGAGALVTRSVPDHGLVYGSPARLNGFVCRCGATLVRDGETGSCPRGCGQYRITNGGGCRGLGDSDDG